MEATISCNRFRESGAAGANGEASEDLQGHVRQGTGAFVAPLDVGGGEDGTERCLGTA